MALVVTSSALPSSVSGPLWSKDQSDEKRPPERAPRRLSSGSSNADTCDSSNTNSSSQHSSAPTVGVHTSTTTKKKPHQRSPEFILHVEGCEFAVHPRLVKRKCHVLYTYLQRLRVQHVVSGHGIDNDLEPVRPQGSTGVDDADIQWKPTKGDVDTNASHLMLRQRDPHAASTPTNHRVHCPLLARHQLVDGASSTRFTWVCCLANQKPDTRAAAMSSPEPRRPQDSPGKENYAQVRTASTPTLRSRDIVNTPRIRVALAPKMPFMSQSSTSSSSTVSPPSTGHKPASPASSASPQRAYAPSTVHEPQPVDHTRGPFRVELLGTSAEAMAVVLDYLHSGKTSALTPSTAVDVTRLCKWLCLEDRLLFAALVVRTREMQSVSQWMDLLLACTSLRSTTQRDILVDHLLKRLVELAPSQYAAAMKGMPLHRLAAIEDPELLGKVVVCMVNHLRHVEIWQRLTTAIELWLYWHFHQPFATASTTSSTMSSTGGSTIRPPVSLLEFHHHFAAWDPVVRLQSHTVSGVDAYVMPTTLFSFGKFAFQVRFEPDRRDIMLWRVARHAATTAAASTSTPTLDHDPQKTDPTLLSFEENNDLYFAGSAFTMRGRLSVEFRRGSQVGQRVLQDDVALRYTHTRSVFGKWLPLVSSSNPSAPPVNTSQSTDTEDKTQDPVESSEEETAPLHEAAEPEQASAPATEPSTGPQTQPQDSQNSHSHSHGDSPNFDPLVASFSGQLFVWGHRLCNLYHFLLLSTLFYQLPADAPPELRQQATLAKMRELPVATLLVVLDSDRLRVPEGESSVAAALDAFCFSHHGTTRYTIEAIRALMACVRWSYVDLDQIMLLLEHAPRAVGLYGIVERQLFEYASHRSAERRAPWGVNKLETPYRPTTTLVEFQIEAGDRSLSPSKFLDGF